MVHRGHLVDEVAQGLDSRLARKYRFKQKGHVNLQETRAMKAELKGRCQAGPVYQRVLNLSDSRAAIGAWAKGRSSSR